MNAFPRSFPAAIAASATASVESENTPASDRDPLLACLRYLAAQHGLPFSAPAVINHLPVGADGLLTPKLFVRAAERLGFKAHLVERRPSKVPGILVPFVALFPHGEAAVVTEKSKRSYTGKARWKVVFPLVSDAPRTMTAAQLDSEMLDVVIYIAPSERRQAFESGETFTTDRHWFWGEVRRYWPAWIQIVVAAFVLNLLGLAFPLFVMSIYDRVIPNLAIPTLWALTAGIAVSVLFEFILRQARSKALDETGKRIDMRIASMLFEHALAISMSDRRVETGALASQIRDFETVRDFFTSSSVIAISDLLFIGMFIFVLFAIVGPIGYVPLIAVPIVLLVTLLLQIPMDRSVRVASFEASRRHSLLIESLAAIETVKSVGAEGVLQRRWENAVTANARAATSTRLWSSWALYLTGAVQQIVSIVVLVWGVFLVADGKISVGGLIAANLLAGRCLAPLSNIAMTLGRARQSFIAMHAITALMKLSADRPPLLRGGETVRNGDVEFSGVHFKYPGSEIEVIANVSMRIGAGERVGILGRVGSGKSTVGKLMAGLYPTSGGTVLIDGIEIRRYDPAELRAAVGFVSQEPELFAGTLRENITLGHPRATEDEIAEAVRTSGMEGFTKAHPLGLARRLGERGAGLSGGQRQAVALARMLLRRPKILFLDEPSSAMDASTEADLIRRIRSWCDQGTTLIICSHRTSFLELVDRLIVIDGGKIVADGPRDDILRRLGAADATLRAAAS